MEFLKASKGPRTVECNFAFSEYHTHFPTPPFTLPTPRPTLAVFYNVNLYYVEIDLLLLYLLSSNYVKQYLCCHTDLLSCIM